MPEFTPLCSLEVEVADPFDFGITPAGHRRVINIVGGSFSGSRMSGVVLGGGADWQIIRPDGVAVLDARYTLRTDAGDFIQVTSQGLRHGPPEVIARLGRGERVDPKLYYFRTVLRFEAGAASLAWLNTIIAVASGVRTRNLVELEAFELR
ncbi:MAG: hypothetical protein A2V78_03485 [Betaproteobacteria bacterium RBG_16_64_18]|nr:MAG: hypothetical protein A2V78_03485 [Betaproteobacteria bacterium RBG_16_64_18]OGA08698.1 MAG: hypothetical protein A3H33_00115 [Betaproteobacteria bacterium RIFCSPLOWO2_02_FULL_65_20]OGB66209.1 MAG: hypothetical protein A3G29_15910 [Burkholderiales bacterium RIFCSPLOWO2_12_FULL_64_99]